MAGFDEGRAAGGSQPLFYHYLRPLCPARAKRRARGTSRAGSGLLSAAMRRRVHSHERSARCAVAHPAADRVFVSIVIANYNYARFLRRCIDSALGQDHPQVAVVVVDDASSDESAAVIRSYGSRVVPCLEKSNGGPAAPCNAGFRSEERRDGNEGVSTCISRGWQDH